jgi:hypothetical protein
MEKLEGMNTQDAIDILSMIKDRLYLNDCEGEEYEFIDSLDEIINWMRER